MNKKTLIKIWINIVSFISIICILIILYSFLFEHDKIKTDKYNFEQLDKAKVILDEIPNDAEKFYTLIEFNKLYNTDIKPITNCYIINNDNWNEPYMFWFKIESLIYRILYRSIYYAYPKYDIPVRMMYTWANVGWNFSWWPYDFSRDLFEYIVTHPCKEEY